jgi:hypothetical protein
MERFATPSDAVRDLYDDIAFLGRYCGQQRSEVGVMIVSERRELCAATVRLLEAERETPQLPGQGNDDIRGR